MKLTCMLLLGVTALSACACRTAEIDSERPARITAHTAESRAELERVVSDALDGAGVLLADDALTESSLLTVERSAHRDARGVRVQGRELGAPEQFRLVHTGEGCVLIHLNTSQRVALTETDCAPE
jgi:hypothetical protein